MAFETHSFAGYNHVSGFCQAFVHVLSARKLGDWYQAGVSWLSKITTGVVC
jgi:hypothetical protein